MGLPWWRRRVAGAPGRQCGRNVGGCRLPVRPVSAATAIVAAASPLCGCSCVGHESEGRRVGGAADWRRGGSAVRQPRWQLHVADAASGRFCSRCGGGGLEV